MNAPQPIKSVTSAANQPVKHYARADRVMLELVKLARHDSVDRRLSIMKTVFPDILVDAQHFTTAVLTAIWKPTNDEHARLEAIRSKYGLGYRAGLSKLRRPFLTEVFREACRLCEDSDTGLGDDPVLHAGRAQTRAARKGAHR